MNHRRFVTVMALVVACVSVGVTASTSRADVVYEDSFTRADNATSLGSADVGGAWTQVDGDNDLGILSNRAYFDAISGSGIFSGVQMLSGVVLGGAVSAEWGLSARYDRGNWLDLSWGEYTDRGGFGMVLCATDTDLTAASGYAVVTDKVNDQNTLRLVRFSGGFTDKANWTDIAAVPAAFIGSDTGYVVAMHVTLDAATGTWTLYASKSSSEWVDPLSVTNTLTSGVDTTYFAQSMVTSGLAVYSSGSSSNDYTLDDVSMSVVVPEPVSAGVALLGLAALRRRTHSST